MWGPGWNVEKTDVDLEITSQGWGGEGTLKGEGEEEKGAMAPWKTIRENICQRDGLLKKERERESEKK